METMKVYLKVKIITIQYLQAIDKWHHNAWLYQVEVSFQYNFLWINNTKNL